VSGANFSVVVDRVSAAGAVLTVTPTAPADGQATTAPAPDVAAVPGSVMAGQDAPAAPAAAAPPQTVPVPAMTAPTSRPTPALASAADASTGSPYLLAAAGALLAGCALLVVRRLRTAAFRRR
jgi:hypothetical protein